jgi:hypothetical protein
VVVWCSVSVYGHDGDAAADAHRGAEPVAAVSTPPLAARYLRDTRRDETTPDETTQGQEMRGEDRRGQERTTRDPNNAAEHDEH